MDIVHDKIMNSVYKCIRLWLFSDLKVGGQTSSNFTLVAALLLETRDLRLADIGVRVKEVTLYVKRI